MKRWNVGPSGQTYGDVPRSLAAIHLREKKYLTKKKLSFRWRVSSVTLINEPIRCDVGTTKKKKKKNSFEAIRSDFLFFPSFCFWFRNKKKHSSVGIRRRTTRNPSPFWPFVAEKKTKSKTKDEATTLATAVVGPGGARYRRVLILPSFVTGFLSLSRFV